MLILNKIKQLLDKLKSNNYVLSVFNLGIRPKMNLSQQKEIRLLNTMCILIVFGSMLNAPMGIFLNNQLIKPLPLIGYSLSIFFYTIVCLLQYSQKYTFAKILFILTNFFIGLIFDLYILPDLGVKYYYVIPPLLSIIIFKSKWPSLLAMLLGIFLFYKFYDLNIKIESNKLHFISLFTTLFSIVYYLKKINQKNEVELRIQQLELEKLNEFKSQFFINLSHEIRTPITLIKGYTSQINLKEDESINTHKLNIVKNQTTQIEGIVNSILDLSKLDENKLPLHCTTTDLKDFLNKHYADFKTLFDKKEILFNLNIKDKDLNVFMDVDLINKAFTNLINNALKFTSKKGRVTINAYLKNDLIIEVTDTGIGIPKQDITKVFNRFYQSKNHITKSQGSGLGLSFAKNILNAHGFSIKVSSIPDVETSFKINIPKKYISNTITTKNSKKEAEPTTIVKNTDDVAVIHKNKTTILVVDDHEQMRTYLASTLQHYNILKAENGKEALEMLKNNKIDLLLTDYMMPIMDGEQLVKQIKKQKLNLPVIILTARVDDFAKLNMLRMGVDGYLNKPFIEEELLLIVKNSLKMYANIVEIKKTLKPEDKEYLDTYGTKFKEQISAYVLSNISDLELNIQDISDYFNISQSTLNRRLKSVLGQTANQFIMQVKIEKARQLQITNPELSKKEIGFSVGFKNTTHLFNKIAEKYGDHYKI